MRALECPFCGAIWTDSNATVIKGDVLFESSVSYIECPCGAVYCPERLRVNHGEVDEGD